MKWFPTLKSIYHDIRLARDLQTNSTFIRGLSKCMGITYLTIMTTDGSGAFAVPIDVKELERLIKEFKEKQEK